MEDDSVSVLVRPTLSLLGHSRPVACVRFSPSGTALASAGADKAVRLWSLPAAGAAAAGASANPSSSSSAVATAASPSSWALPALRAGAVLEGHSQGVSDLAWSPDGAYVASASDDGSVRIWDAATGRAACRPLRGHANHVMSLSFHPHAGLLASGSFDESVKLWDLRAARCVRTIQAHSEPLTSVLFHEDGSTLATAAFDGLVRLWSHASGQCLKTLQVEGAGAPPVGALRFSPNGARPVA